MRRTELTEAVIEIICALKSDDRLDDKWLDKFVRARNKHSHDPLRTVAKRRLMPEYLRIKRDEPELLERLGVVAELDKRIISLLQAKPRRTASGVATITVLMKPWPCGGDCVFCPNDILMPKSYIHNEPACQRAARWNFDPYMQVISRLTALQDMGHNIDKIELIVLGGTFSDYKRDYQCWFIKELFRACNEFSDNGGRSFGPDFKQTCAERGTVLKNNLGTVLDDVAKERRGRSFEATGDGPSIQKELNSGKLTYNEAWQKVYSEQEEEDSSHRKVA